VAHAHTRVTLTVWRANIKPYNHPSLYSAFRYVSLLKTENADQRAGHAVTSASDNGSEVSQVLVALLNFPSRKNISNTEEFVTLLILYHVLQL
jgi:hypothetical protein